MEERGYTFGSLNCNYLKLNDYLIYLEVSCLLIYLSDWSTLFIIFSIPANICACVIWIHIPWIIWYYFVTLKPTWGMGEEIYKFKECGRRKGLFFSSNSWKVNPMHSSKIQGWERNKLTPYLDKRFTGGCSWAIYPELYHTEELHHLWVFRIKFKSYATCLSLVTWTNYGWILLNSLLLHQNFEVKVIIEVFIFNMPPQVECLFLQAFSLAVFLFLNPLFKCIPGENWTCATLRHCT